MMCDSTPMEHFTFQTSNAYKAYQAIFAAQTNAVQTCFDLDLYTHFFRAQTRLTLKGRKKERTRRQNEGQSDIITAHAERSRAHALNIDSRT